MIQDKVREEEMLTQSKFNKGSNYLDRMSNFHLLREHRVLWSSEMLKLLDYFCVKNSVSVGPI
jgi:hypothetical protein